MQYILDFSALFMERPSVAIFFAALKSASISFPQFVHLKDLLFRVPMWWQTLQVWEVYAGSTAINSTPFSFALYSIKERN